MKKIDINPGSPFEEVVAKALALPGDHGRDAVNDKQVVHAIRCLHELAHGRSVQTALGLIPIAPAIERSSTNTRLSVRSRRELLAMVEERIAPAGNAEPIRKPNNSSMKNVPLHITPHDFELSPALREFVHQKMSALSRFARDVLAAEVVIRKPSGAAHLFSVSARLALPGRDVQGNATHGNVYGAIHKLVDRLARLSRKRKTRLTTMLRRADRKRLKPCSERSPLVAWP